jgi:hypothetical protein
MKILWRKRGFTTNSSGSYEWLPGAASSTSTSSASTTLPIATATTQTALAPRFDLLILVASIITGIIAITLLVKEMFQTKKTKNAHHQKR